MKKFTTQKLCASKVGIAFVLCCLLSVGGCRTFLEPIRNAQYSTENLGAVTNEQMKMAIHQGLVKQGWTLVTDAPGEIFAKVTVRDETAIIKIRYNTVSFTIEHEESTRGLGYNGEIVHKMYNIWVDRLSNVIQTYLMPFFSTSSLPGGGVVPDDTANKSDNSVTMSVEKMTSSVETTAEPVETTTEPVETTTEPVETTDEPADP